MKNANLFSNRNFILLWIGQVISQLGNSLYELAIMWYILQKTGSSMAMGVSVVCYTIPTILFGLVAGVFADRYDKKKIIMFSDLINGIIMLLTCFFIAKDMISIYGLYLIMILTSSVAAMFSPAISSIWPLIVKEEDLTKRNSLSQITNRACTILGPVLSGILLAAFHIWILFLINGISFLIAVLMESFITVPAVNKRKAVNEKFFFQMKEGILYITKTRSLLHLVFVGGLIINFFLAPLTIYSAVISKNLQRGSVGLGMLESSVGIGALAGGFIIFLGVMKNKYKIAIAGLALEGIGLMGYGMFSNSFYVILVFASVIGIGVSMASVGISTLFQTLVDKDKMGRVMSALGILCTISVPIGTMCCSAVINYCPVGIVLLISGIIVTISAISLIPIFKDRITNKIDEEKTSVINY
ncbi:MFS transporter [Clostridium oryzae]|uniref:Putative bacilysin exporter BacE n=1 Tax=Clostridium oryzae TaxID=1450648 RepID=A0A1V4ISD7_9CLOT|nr:MFS transporter [Clostridium oryzae]OPJ62377.1 putative bacilysin exporter BacE [Clostridium oryzae]